VVNIYKRMLAIKRKKKMGHSLMRMDIENVIQSEVSQKEKNTHYILMLISGI